MPLCLAAGRIAVFAALGFGLLSSVSAQTYSENFDSGAATDWVVASGTYAVVSGTYNCTSLTGGPNVSYYNDASWDTSFTYTASVRLYGSGSANCVGLVYYYQDLNHYYEVELNPVKPTGTVQLYEHINSAAGTVVATGTFPSNGGGNFQTVSIVRSGTTTTIKVNGTTVITRTQTALTGGGKFGVVSRWAGGRTDNVSVAGTVVPNVTITAPADQSQISGTVTVSADASDSLGIAGVQFQLDGANLGAEVTTSPYSISWDTSTATNSQHVLTAIARDTAGTLATSPGITITTSNNGGLPSTWNTQDIGSPAAAGSVNYSNGTYTVQGAGTGIANTSDGFRFVYQPITGDATVIAKVDSVSAVGDNGGEHGGIMFRETLNANSAYVGAYETAGNGLVLEARSSTGASAAGYGTDTSHGSPYWVKLVRAGNVFTAYGSPDGRAWTMLGTSQTVTMAASIYVGLAVSSEIDATPTTAVYENVAIANGVLGNYKTAFPRIAGILYNPNYDNATFQAAIAKHDLAILNFWRLWNRSGLTIRQAVQQIKARNSTIILGNYTIVESADNSVNGDPQIQAVLNAGVGPTANGGTWTPNDWWARDATGAQISEGGTLATNITAFVTPNANGDRYTQWYAKWAYGAYFQSVPEYDFVFSDVTNFQPTISADWNRSGVNASKSDPTVGTYYRQGMASYWAAMNQVDPTLLVVANSDGQTSLNVGYLREPEYQYQVGAALYESAMGHHFSSEEDYSGWYNMMTSYRALLANTAVPHLVIVGSACTTDGKAADSAIQANYGGGAAYAFTRYVLASVLMDNGYCEFHPGTYQEISPMWLDEFDLAGTATTSWLGAPIDPPQTTPYQNGVFVRQFQNGIAIVNPRTNPDLTTRIAQTITPPAGYKRFVGTQDPTTNNGAAVTTITIAAGDGILLTK